MASLTSFVATGTTDLPPDPSSSSYKDMTWTGNSENKTLKKQDSVSVNTNASKPAESNPDIQTEASNASHKAGTDGQSIDPGQGKEAQPHQADNTESNLGMAKRYIALFHQIRGSKIILVRLRDVSREVFR
jgi:hypothetical protein